MSDYEDRDVSVLLVDDDETWVRTQRRLLERNTDRLSVSTATSFEAARARARLDSPDCVVCDYQLGDGTGLELLEDVRRRSATRPFILVTGEGTERVASEAIRDGVTDYVRKATLGRKPTRLAKRIEDAVAAERTRWSLARERERKQALLELVTAGSTRREFGQRLCEYLVTTHGYTCAWIGVRDQEGSLVPLSSAGTAAYLDSAVDPGIRPAESTEPAFRALTESGPVAWSRPDGAGNSAAAAPAADSDWVAAAAAHGITAIEAVPIRHDGVKFGVLSVCSAETAHPDGLSLLTEYAETAGYVFHTSTWRETLLSAAGTSVAFTLRDDRFPLVALCRALPRGTTLRTETVIPRTSGEVLYVATVAGASATALTDAVDATDSVGAVELYRTDGALQCGIVARTPVPERRLVDTGASFAETVVEDGQADVRVVLCGQTTVQRCLDELTAVTDAESVRAHWTHHDCRPSRPSDDRDELTERQRQVLDLAVAAGYFERPRLKNTSELAAALDISRATFTQHLRAAQRKLLS